MGSERKRGRLLWPQFLDRRTRLGYSLRDRMEDDLGAKIAIGLVVLSAFSMLYALVAIR